MEAHWYRIASNETISSILWTIRTTKKCVLSLIQSFVEIWQFWLKSWFWTNFGQISWKPRYNKMGSNRIQLMITIYKRENNNEIIPIDGSQLMVFCFFSRYARQWSGYRSSVLCIFASNFIRSTKMYKIVK